MSKSNSWQKYEIYLTFSKRWYCEMAISFGLVEENPKSLRTKRGRKSFFTPEGKMALAFLKMYTGLSALKLMEALNGNIHYQIFCGIRISPENQLTIYKLIDSILLELSKWELARVRATAMEGSFGTQKEHYGLIFFGIHTANMVNLARRESV